MEITDQHEIYKNIAIGDRIRYYLFGPHARDKTIIEGIVTRFKPCNYKVCGYCKFEIGVNNERTRCFMYAGKTAIISINNDFIEKDEFKL